MTSLTKHCPACGHANDPAEIYCDGLRSDGSRCQYNLLDVEASPPAVSGTPKPAAEDPPAQAQANESGQLSCRNGHPLAPTDQLCLICGAEPSEPNCSALPSGLSEPEQHQSSVEHLGDLSAAEQIGRAHV